MDVSTYNTLAALRTAEDAYRELRRSIIEGHYAPGERLVEERLAADLGMSRTPIRQALARAEAEGLVRILPNRGAVVCSFSLDDLRDTFELRALLESHAADRAAHVRIPADLDELAHAGGAPTARPLSDIRVLELGQFLAGPLPALLRRMPMNEREALVESWRAEFQALYERDRQNAARQPFDDYWQWVRTFFLSGGAGVSGWLAQADQLLQSVGDAQQRAQLAERMQQLGKRIAGEWAKHARTRRIYSTWLQGTPNLQEWGRQLQAAARRDAGDGVAIGQVLAQIERDVAAVLK